MNRLILSSALAALLVAAPASANVPVYSGNITEADVLAAQTGWCAALVAISTDFRTNGLASAKTMAGNVIDAAYGYHLGPVLFKPTLTVVPQTFRPTRAGALAYFVGDDKNFPNDTGFALKNWTACKAENNAIHIDGDIGSSIGNVSFTNTDGQVTTVDKTWSFKKTDDGKVVVVLHHSSLPYVAN